MANNYFIILSDLKSGAYAAKWSVGTEFFEEFENEQIRAAELVAEVRAQRTGASVIVDLTLSGSLTVPCDRCLEDVVMPVDASAMLKVRFGQQPAGEADEEEGRELIWMPAGEPELDLSQVIYDYACLSLPIQCRHREGECSPGTMSYLNPSKVGSPDVEQPVDSPFAALKGLFNKE